MFKLSRRELFQAQAALFVAIGLQLLVWRLNHGILSGPQLLIVATELLLVFVIGFTVNKQNLHDRGVHHNAALVLLGLISVGNIASFVMVLHLLLTSAVPVDGLELLASAMAILTTNIIIFALWYWEIDSPGLTRRRWSKNDKDFQFTQQDMKEDFPDWRPEFIDYLYLSVTNAINFAPADARPLTRTAKVMMGTQALLSVFTLALVLARAVNVLGE